MHRTQLRNSKQSAFSQIETVISVIIVSILIVTSLSTIANSRRSHNREFAKVRGLPLAEALMSEITPLPLREPSCDCGYGLDNSESSGSSTGDRLQYDDVDDYNGYSELPPKTKDGTVLNGFSAFTRSVAVEPVLTSNWDSVTSTYQNIYRITVTVSYGGVVAAKLISYRTDGGTISVQQSF